MKLHARKILFIHPLGVNWMPGEKDMSRIANIMPPIGLCSLAAWVEQHGFTAEIHDCYAFPGSDEMLLRRVTHDPPAWIGISATTSSFMDGIRIAKLIKEKAPGTKTVFGGVHASALKEQLLDTFSEIDFVVAGEGEFTLLELMQGHDPCSIAGLAWRDGENAKFNRPRDPQPDLDIFPLPAYEKLDGFPAAYKLPIFNYPSAPGTTAISSRGCPYQCSYCDRSVFRRSFGFHSAGYMLDLLNTLKSRWGMRHVNFYDDLFTYDRARIEAFCEGMIREKVSMTFNCAARAEHLDTDLLRLLKRAGCWMISLGIESGDRELLKKHRSNADLDLIEKRVGEILAAGMRAKGLFMLGLPGETEESIERTIRYALRLPLSDLNVAKFTPFPGSPLYKAIAQRGNFDENWPLMNCLNFVYEPEGLTRERLEQRFREFYRRYYERPGVLLGYVGMLWKSPDSWRRFVADFGAFINFTKGYRAHP